MEKASGLLTEAIRTAQAVKARRERQLTINDERALGQLPHGALDIARHVALGHLGLVPPRSGARAGASPVGAGASSEAMKGRP